MDTKLAILISSDDYETSAEITNDLMYKLYDLEEIKIKQSRKKTQAGKAGGLVDTVLNLVFGKEVFSKILDILKAIIVGKPKKTSVSIKCPNGATLMITEENIKNGVITPETITNFCNSVDPTKK